MSDEEYDILKNLLKINILIILLFKVMQCSVAVEKNEITF